MTEHELDTLLRDYGGAVRSVCRAILPGHPQDAEEAEADTFYKLWRGAHLPADEAHRRRLVVQTARQCAKKCWPAARSPGFCAAGGWQPRRQRSA